jgi:hypothetical protein
MRGQLPRTVQAVEKLPWWPLSPQIGHQSAPNTLLLGLLEPDVCGRYQLNSDFFNRLASSRSFGF